MLGGERLHMLHEGQGPARKDRPRASQKGTVCTWCARRAASSAYVSTNSGEEERRDEIMGPTASRTQSGRLLCPGISDFGGHLVLGAGAQDPGDRKPLWPPLSPIIHHIYPNFLCTGSSFSLLCPQSRKLDLPYCPAFQNSSRNNRTLLSILKSNLPLCFPPVFSCFS